MEHSVMNKLKQFCSCGFTSLSKNLKDFKWTITSFMLMSVINPQLPILFQELVY